MRWKLRDVALAGGLSGTLVCLVELGNVGFDGQLDSVVHLGGQHLILGVHLGKCIVNLLVLGLVRFRGSVHRVQTFAVAGKQAQGQFPADLGAHGRVQRARRLLILAGGGI